MTMSAKQITVDTDLSADDYVEVTVHGVETDNGMGYVDNYLTVREAEILVVDLQEAIADIKLERLASDS